MAQDEPSSGRVSAGLQEIDVVLGGVDDVVEVAAHHLLGEAEREARRGGGQAADSGRLSEPVSLQSQVTIR